MIIIQFIFTAATEWSVATRKKNRLIVDYALKDTSQPIGVAEYKITKCLPKALKGFLPSTSKLKDKFKELDL